MSILKSNKLNYLFLFGPLVLLVVSNFQLHFKADSLSMIAAEIAAIVVLAIIALIAAIAQDALPVSNGDARGGLTAGGSGDVKTDLQKTLLTGLLVALIYAVFYWG